MTQQDHISRKRVVYTIDGMDAVTIRRDLPYAESDAGPLTMDVYYPPAMHSRQRLPLVLIVTGFSDCGAEMMMGCKFKEMGAYISWAQLIAASGCIAIRGTYLTVPKTNPMERSIGL
jgi:hypothetical protein